MVPLHHANYAVCKCPHSGPDHSLAPAGRAPQNVASPLSAFASNPTPLLPGPTSGPTFGGGLIGRVTTRNASSAAAMAAMVAEREEFRRRKARMHWRHAISRVIAAKNERYLSR